MIGSRLATGFRELLTVPPEQKRFIRNVFFTIYGILMGLSTAMFIRYNHAQLEQTKQMIANQTIHLVELEVQILTQTLREIATDVRMNAQCNTRLPQFKETRELQFQNLLQNRTFYDRLTWVDTHGYEVVKVIRKNGAVRSAAINKNNTIEDTLYFKNVMELGAGQIYLSKFGTDRSPGSVESSLLLRVAAPMISESGERLGILVLEVSGLQLKSRFFAIAPDRTYLFGLVNTEGILIFEPDSEETPFFERGSTSSVYSDLWERIAQGTVGYFVNEKYGTVSYATLDPGTALNPNNHSPGTLWNKWTVPANRYWKVVSVTPNAVAAKNMESTTHLLIAIYLGLAVVWAGLAWVLAQFAAKSKSAEQNLAENVQKSMAVVNTALEGIVTFDPLGIIETFNPHAEKIFDYQASEIIGKNVSRLMSESAGKSKMGDWASTFTTSDSHDGSFREIHGRRKNGELFPLEIAVNRVVFQEEVLFTALMRDITQRKQAEQALASEKERLAVTLRSIGDGVITTDVMSKVIMLNQIAETLTGWVQAEAVGQDLKEILQLCNAKTDELRKDIYEHAETQGDTDDGSAFVFPLETALVSKSGGKCIIEGTCSLIKDQLNFHIGHVFVFRDITERLKMENQLALSSKMDSIGRLAAGVAHEINTPLQYVGDNLRFLNECFASVNELLQVYRSYAQTTPENPESKPKQADLQRKEKDVEADYLMEEIPKSIQESSSGIQRVSKLVMAMKKFSHPSQSEKKPTDINQSVEGTVVISRNEWKYHADLETNLDPALPMVPCVVDELNQVLLNMVVNAADAIKEAVEKKLIERGKITLSTAQENGFVKIIVSDNGVGIPTEIQSKIFELFFTTKPVGKGTGQGLAITHDIIVNKHGGRIDLQSDPGKGAAFTLLLPIDPPQKPMELKS